MPRLVTVTFDLALLAPDDLLALQRLAVLAATDETVGVAHEVPAELERRFPAVFEAAQAQPQTVEAR